MKNKIVNYFVSLPSKDGGMPRVFRSPVTMNATVAKDLLNKQLKNTNKDLTRGDLLHVCFDVDSDIIYLPNASVFSQDILTPLLQAAKIRISKEFGGYAGRPPISGSPFSSIRVRSLSSFPYANKTVSNHYEGKIYKDIPVVEADMNKMPTTKKALPPIFKQQGFMGGYISPSYAKSVSFYQEIDIKGNKIASPSLLLKQETPFILINMERGTTRGNEEPSATEKEGVVLNGYRDYLYDTQAAETEKYIANDISSFADLYSIKRQLYLGWSLEEVARALVGTVNTFPSLIEFIQRLMDASNSLVEEGYKDVAANPYYLTFKIDPETFPLNISNLMDMKTGRIDPLKQLYYFKVIDYDLKTEYIIIETPVYVPSQLCKQVLMAKTIPFISKYNPVSNSIDCKSEDSSYDKLKLEKRQLAKIKALVGREVPEEKQKTLDYRVGPEARGEWATDPNVYNVRKISDYLYATDYIKEMCDNLNIDFEDLDVIIGPIERIFGAGTQGGFINAEQFKKNKLDIPYKLQEGLYITPPCIVMNSVSQPSYAAQTETLVHEYRHHIYGQQNPNYEKGYGDMSNKKGDEYTKEWDRYLSDPNEREAHLIEIKFALALGKSADEIIRDKVGPITMDNYPRAIKFEDLVRQAIEEERIKEEQNEKPNGTS